MVTHVLANRRDLTCEQGRLGQKLEGAVDKREQIHHWRLSSENQQNEIGGGKGKTSELLPKAFESPHLQTRRSQTGGEKRGQ